MKEALSSTSRDRKPAKELESIHLRAAENGGVIAEHHFTSYEHKPEPHVFGEHDGDGLQEHIEEHLPITHDMPSKPNAETETGGAIAEKK